VNEGPESLLSIASDGIPIAEELSPESSHYLWSSDLHPASGSSSATPDEADDEEESSIDTDSDDEDLEIIPEIDLSNLYPSEELPPTYAEVWRSWLMAAVLSIDPVITYIFRLRAETHTIIAAIKK
jgi:hypothetical protein